MVRSREAGELLRQFRTVNIAGLYLVLPSQSSKVFSRLFQELQRSWSADWLRRLPLVVAQFDVPLSTPGLPLTSAVFQGSLAVAPEVPSPLLLR